MNETELTGLEKFNALVYLAYSVECWDRELLLFHKNRVKPGIYHYDDDWEDSGFWVNTVLDSPNYFYFYQADLEIFNDWVAQGRPAFSYTVHREDYPELFNTEELSLSLYERFEIRQAHSRREEFTLYDDEDQLEYCENPVDKQRLLELFAPAIEIQEQRWQQLLGELESRWELAKSEED